MKYRVNVLPNAQVEIRRNAYWWSQNRSHEQAKKWTRLLLEKIRTLGNDPLRHAVAEENLRFSVELREVLFGLGRKPTHRIVFTTSDDTVFIVAVRHVSQDAIQEVIDIEDIP